MMISIRTVAGFVAVLLIGQSIAGAAVATPNSPGNNWATRCVKTPPSSTGTLPVTVIRGPVDNSVTLKVSPDDARSKIVSGWGIKLPEESELYSKSGFGTPPGRERFYRPLSNSQNYTLTYTFKENVSTELTAESGVEKFEGEDEWAIAPLPSKYSGDIYYRTPAEAVIGQETVYFGDYTMTTVANGCHQIRLVVPESVSYVETLTHHQRALYQIIEEHELISPSDLYEKYQQRVDDPKTNRTVRNYLSKMDQYDIIEAAGTSRDRTYRSVSESFEHIE